MESHRKPRVLVTGGSGFVGRHVLAALKTGGYYTANLDKRPCDGAEADEFFNVDLTDALRVTLFVGGFEPDFIVHLAAIHFIPYCNQHPLETFDTNVRGTENLLSAASYTNCQRFFLASSAAVYAPDTVAHKETSAAWPNDIYGFSKRAAELATQTWAYRTGIKVVLGRYFNMYGWGETTPHFIPAILRQVLRGETTLKLGNISTYRDYTHISDNALATVQLLELPLPELVTTVNLGTGQPTNGEEIITLLACLADRPLQYMPNEQAMRVSDRPYLTADLSYARELGVRMPTVSLPAGLAELLLRGLGPYIQWL